MSTGTIAPVAELWLYTVLSGDATLTGLVGARIYEGNAPAGATLPAVIFADVRGGGVDVAVVGAHRVWVETDYLVTAVDQTDDITTLSAIADRVDALLHDQTQQAVTGGTVASCVRVGEVRGRVVEDGITYQRLGGRYRLRVQRS